MHLQEKPSLFKTALRFLRKVLFKNKAVERFILFLSNNSLTHQFSRRLIVPNTDYSLHTYRTAKRNNTTLRLDLSNEVDHFIYFKNRDTSFDYLHDEISSSSVILDIGGNIGAFALLFEKLAPGAAIYTFEPHPLTYSRLVENLTLNKSRVKSYNVGLGSERGKFRMYEVDKNNPGMNRLFMEEQQYPSVSIEVTTLDEFWGEKEKIDFIKMDVEGYELSVLRGGQKTLRKYHPTLVIELDDNNLRNNGGSAEELVSFLVELGYNNVLTSDKKRKVESTDHFSDCHYDIVATRI